MDFWEIHFVRQILIFLSCASAIIGSAVGEEVAHALSKSERAQLRRDKVIITDSAYRQVFSPYIYSDEPVFITSDSILNAWHVLLEESIGMVEERFARELPAALDEALVALPREAPQGMSRQQFESATRRAKIVLGTASVLAGGKWSGGNELDALIAIDVRRVEAARDVALPEWMRAEGSPIEGLDYAVFRPTGIYSANPRMERYFRSVRWLQSVPFDLTKDDQLAAMGLVIAAMDQSGKVMGMAEAFELLMGEGASLDAYRLRHDPYGSSLFDVVGWIRSVKQESEEEPFKTEIQRPAVMLSPRGFPDVDLFQKSTNESRPFPESLEVAAWLGSPLAEKLMTKGVRSAKIDHALSPQGMYAAYALCLSDLFAPPERGAPDFMKTEIWQRKSLNTGLASWAQFRHAWSLQGKEDAHWMGLDEANPVGFVEPNPEFFRHFGNLVSTCGKHFDRLKCPPLTGNDVSRRANDLVPLIEATVGPCRKVKEAKRNKMELSKEDREAYRKAMEAACEPLGFFHPVLDGSSGISNISMGRTGIRIGSIDDPESLLRVLRKIAQGEGINEVMAKLGSDLNEDRILDRWGELLDICRQLETLAHKQLRGVQPAKDEVMFIQSYGERLAGIMFYEGNSWLVPRDDAPRIASVFCQPSRGFLLAGTGRPLEIRVLYPWKGKEIECRGAVMPFREMRSDRHLTDSEWRDVLKSNKSPAKPDWLKPITSEK